MRNFLCLGLTGSMFLGKATLQCMYPRFCEASEHETTGLSSFLDMVHYISFLVNYSNVDSPNLNSNWSSNCVLCGVEFGVSIPLWSAPPSNFR